MQYQPIHIARPLSNPLFGERERERESTAAHSKKIFSYIIYNSVIAVENMLQNAQKRDLEGKKKRLSQKSNFYFTARFAKMVTEQWLLSEVEVKRKERKVLIIKHVPLRSLR